MASKIEAIKAAIEALPEVDEDIAPENVRGFIRK